MGDTMYQKRLEKGRFHAGIVVAALADAKDRELAANGQSGARGY